MPEYLAPGVYVEETSFRSKSIEGVSTTTTGFIGPARFGPLAIEPDVLTSLADFERVYGGRDQLNFTGATGFDNFLWHAARAFFEEGGMRLYVSRVFHANDASDDGIARGSITGNSLQIKLNARFPGEAGNAKVRFTLKAGHNVLVPDANGLPAVRSVQDRDVVWIRDISSPFDASIPTGGSFYLALWDQRNDTWIFSATGHANDVSGSLTLSQLAPDTGHELRIITVSTVLTSVDSSNDPVIVSELPLDPLHERAGAPDSLFSYFAAEPASTDLARTLPLVIEQVDATVTGLDVLHALFDSQPGISPSDPSLQDALLDTESSDDARSYTTLIDHGNDGTRPDASDYEGTASLTATTKTGLKQFEDLEDISIVAAPGATFSYNAGYKTNAQTIINLLIAHAELMRYRIAVLDAGDDMSISDVRELRGRIDSTYGALYYPWVRILDPVTKNELNLPPSGFVAGIYARNDIQRGVWKAPANEVVTLAIGFEKLLNKGQQDVLNPEGINCFRFFEDRGFRLWGARTISSDPEWKYVNLRRYFAYLEHSIDKGTQWAVFEPNGDALWANVRRTIEDFLLNEWQSGALLGDKPEKAYFVKCDRSTMSQNDLDNGRLVCLVGVAPLRPAEFVIFRIGQWTSDRKS
jgi:hypothetical protein